MCIFHRQSRTVCFGPSTNRNFENTVHTHQTNFSAVSLFQVTRGADPSTAYPGTRALLCIVRLFFAVDSSRLKTNHSLSYFHEAILLFSSSQSLLSPFFSLTARFLLVDNDRCIFSVKALTYIMTPSLPGNNYCILYAE